MLLKNNLSGVEFKTFEAVVRRYYTAKHKLGISISANAEVFYNKY